MSHFIRPRLDRLPGVIVGKKYELPKDTGHKHEWQTIERYADDKFWKIHVCVSKVHDKPVMEPYDVFSGHEVKQ